MSVSCGQCSMKCPLHAFTACIASKLHLTVSNLCWIQNEHLPAALLAARCQQCHYTIHSPLSIPKFSISFNVKWFMRCSQDLLCLLYQRLQGFVYLPFLVLFTTVQASRDDHSYYFYHESVKDALEPNGQTSLI